MVSCWLLDAICRMRYRMLSSNTFIWQKENQEHFQVLYWYFKFSIVYWYLLDRNAKDVLLNQKKSQYTPINKLYCSSMCISYLDNEIQAECEPGWSVVLTCGPSQYLYISGTRSKDRHAQNKKVQPVRLEELTYWYLFKWDLRMWSVERSNGAVYISISNHFWSIIKYLTESVFN